ncbi:hypothetical protein BDV95DRAFT_600356 [Massariosphaeria phaeospora]|uniref:Uncharacterized protein n=1 Tax=Massariosphaeria phaeospora TaxID=100035 RepID=A0A7C8HZL2_9PLEO|nr:hypothetical protein BDV95DRAFT_600356 [Massariosphaeria phaeospora]
MSSLSHFYGDAEKARMNERALEVQELNTAVDQLERQLSTHTTVKRIVHVNDRQTATRIQYDFGHFLTSYNQMISINLMAMKREVNTLRRGIEKTFIQRKDISNTQPSRRGKPRTVAGYDKRLLVLYKNLHAEEEGLLEYLRTYRIALQKQCDFYNSSKSNFPTQQTVLAKRSGPWILQNEVYQVSKGDEFGGPACPWAVPFHVYQAGKEDEILGQKASLRIARALYRMEDDVGSRTTSLYSIDSLVRKEQLRQSSDIVSGVKNASQLADDFQQCAIELRNSYTCATAWKVYVDVHKVLDEIMEANNTTNPTELLSTVCSVSTTTSRLDEATKDYKVSRKNLVDAIKAVKQDATTLQSSLVKPKSWLEYIWPCKEDAESSKLTELFPEIMGNINSIERDIFALNASSRVFDDAVNTWNAGLATGKDRWSIAKTLQLWNVVFSISIKVPE